MNVLIVNLLEIRLHKNIDRYKEFKNIIESVS